jgi:hypothetical protein
MDTRTNTPEFTLNWYRREVGPRTSRDLTPGFLCTYEHTNLRCLWPPVPNGPCARGNWYARNLRADAHLARIFDEK